MVRYQIIDSTKYFKHELQDVTWISQLHSGSATEEAMTVKTKFYFLNQTEIRVTISALLN